MRIETERKRTAGQERELLLRAHEVAAELAAGGSCKKGWKGFSGDCGPYHVYFPLFDALGLVSSPRNHREWYRNSLENIKLQQPDSPFPRILIPGLATPMMAKIVLDSCPKAELDIVDICRTPLEATRRVLQLDEKHRFVQADARELARAKELRPPYMAIVTDAFLTRFSDEEKLTVLRQFTKLLKPNGALITTWRLPDKGRRPSPEDSGYGGEFERSEFARQFVARAGELEIDYQIQDVMAALAYAEKMRSYRGQDEDGIRELLGWCFEDVILETTEWPYPSRFQYDVTPRHYARILATKPKIN